MENQYIVGGSNLVIDGETFLPGSEMTAIDKIPPEQLAFFLKGGHLIEKAATEEAE